MVATKGFDIAGGCTFFLEMEAYPGPLHHNDAHGEAWGTSSLEHEAAALWRRRDLPLLGSGMGGNFWEDANVQGRGLEECGPLDLKSNVPDGGVALGSGMEGL